MLQSCPSLYCSTVATPRFPLSLPLTPLLQSSRVLVCSMPPGSFTFLRYLFVFCTASLQSHRPLHLLPLPLVPHHSSSSSSPISVLLVCSTPYSLAISLRRLARVPGPAFLSPGNCSNFDPRDTLAGPVGTRTLVPVFLTQQSGNPADSMQTWALLMFNYWFDNCFINKFSNFFTSKLHRYNE